MHASVASDFGATEAAERRSEHVHASVASDFGATEASTAGAAAGGAIGCSGLTWVTITDSVVSTGDGELGDSAVLSNSAVLGGGVAPPASLWTSRRVLTLTSTLAGSGDCE